MPCHISDVVHSPSLPLVSHNPHVSPVSDIMLNSDHNHKREVGNLFLIEQRRSLRASDWLGAPGQ